MKFLVTGSLNKKQGVARLLSATSLYFIVFLAARLYHEYGYLSGNKIEPAAVIAEEAHADIFYFSLLFLFAGSVARELFAIRYRGGIIMVLFIAGVIFPLAKILYAYFPSLYMVYVVSGVAAFGLYLPVMAYILYRLRG